MLFDDIQRVDLEPARHAGPHFPYLNQTARPEGARVRSLVEKWFARYPDDDKDDLRRRFRSESNRSHSAAFFELYNHELLHRVGCSVQVHPSVPTGSKTPDFLVTPPTGERFYCEVVVAFDQSHAEAAASSRINDLRDALNTADSPNFFIHLDTEGEPSAPLPLRAIRQAAERFLRELDPDQMVQQLRDGVSLFEMPALSLEHHGCTIEIRGHPKSPETRGKPGIRSLGMYGSGMEMQVVQSFVATRDALVKKASRYGDLGHPFLISVNAESQHLERIDMMEALFGRETFVFPQYGELGEPEMIRQPNGLWTGPKGPRYTRVSAVLVASAVNPWSVTRYSPWLFHNPWAKLGLPSALDRLSHARPIPNESRMAFTEGVTSQDLFELPAGWPAD